MILVREDCRSEWTATAHGLIMAVLMLFAIVPTMAHAADTGKGSSNTQVLEAFDKQQVERVEAGGLTVKKKQLIMFLLGVPLLILLLTTGALGIAMGVYGKQVFLTHMIFAGLSITLALVHVIVGLVWFYPF